MTTYISAESALKVLRLALPRSRTIEEDARIRGAISSLLGKAPDPIPSASAGCAEYALDEAMQIAVGLGLAKICATRDAQPFEVGSHRGSVEMESVEVVAPPLEATWEIERSEYDCHPMEVVDPVLSVRLDDGQRSESVTYALERVSFSWTFGPVVATATYAPEGV